MTVMGCDDGAMGYDDEVMERSTASIESEKDEAGWASSFLLKAEDLASATALTRGVTETCT
jgi:hypothetical protein